jgi:hypothetical protein
MASHELDFAASSAHYAHYSEMAEAATKAAESARSAWNAIKPRRLPVDLTDEQKAASARARIASAMERAAWLEAARVVIDNASDKARAMRVAKCALNDVAPKDTMGNNLVTVERMRAIAHGEQWAVQQIAEYWAGAKAMAE